MTKKLDEIALAMNGDMLSVFIELRERYQENMSEEALKNLITSSFTKEQIEKLYDEWVEL